MIKISTFYILIVTLLVASTITAQKDNKSFRNISGQVVDASSGETMAYANLLIKGKKSGTSCNVDGFFSLQGVSVDSLILQIMYVGFDTKELLIPAGKDDITSIKIKLNSGLQLDEISIVANSFKIMKTTDGVSSVHLSPSRIALLPNVGEVDIFRSLQLLPGISASNESSSGLYVRGGTPDQNLVLLDGMTVYNVDHFFGFFSAFNASAIKDVQLYKGAFPAQYGGRLSSVVDLTGKVGDNNEIHGDIGLNLLNTKVGLQIPLFGKGSLIINARRSYTDIIRSGLFKSIFGIFDTEDPSIALLAENGIETNTIEPEFYFFDFNSKLSFRPSEKDNIAISIYAGKDNLLEADFLDINIPIGQTSRDIRRDLNEKSEWGNRGLSGKWSRQWNDTWYSNILIAYSNYFSKYDRNVIFQVSIPERDTTTIDLTFDTFEDNDVRDLSIKLDNELQLGQKHKLGFGIHSTSAEVDYQLIINDTMTILDRNQNGRFSSAYIQDIWRPTDRFAFNAGLRATQYSINDDVYWAPRLSIEYEATDAIKIKTAYGRHYQFVNRVVNENVSEGSRDFWLLGDNDLIKVSQAEHYVLGLTYENDGFVVDIEGYRKNLKNISEFSQRFQRTNSEESDLFFNGDGIAQGVEFLIQKKAGIYTGWLSYTLSEVVHTFPELNEGLSFYALHDSRHEFKMVHSYEIDDWTLGLTWIYADGKPYTEAESLYSIEYLDGTESTYINVGVKNTVRLPAYHRLDVSGHYKIKKGKIEYDFGISIFNLYSRKNVWYRTFDFTGRPPIVTDVRYLGSTPNISIDVRF